MKIQSITITGFRCFGPIATTLELSPRVTAFVGANGSGKTAFLHALLRMFGVSPESRTVKRNDFYVPSGTAPDDRSPRSLSIDVRLSFPELTNDLPSPVAVAPCFQHMQICEPGQPPFCRIRLEASWTDDGTLEGDIEQRLWWVLSDDDLPKDDDKRRVEAFERSLIQVHYVPANREALARLSYAAGAMISRLLKAVEWSSDTRSKVDTLSGEVKDVVRFETAIAAMNRSIKMRWSDLYDEPIDAEPEMQFALSNFDDLIRHFSITFQPTEFGGERALDDLSEGQQSLFYFSLVAALFDIEQMLDETRKQASTVKETEASLEQAKDDPASETIPISEPTGSGFRLEKLQIPALTVFAIEEPENHLAPYFLARIMQVVHSMVESHLAQAVLTSHSSSILARVEPSDIRHCRLDRESRTTVITSIILPTEPSEVGKYVREAVRAYPEIYFARFVVLGEGPSEEIVIPRLASALNGVNLDRSFVAIVPLGGRHVHHFWKLLKQLQIPFATLIDLDLGRAGGGWARIKYACDQLIEVGVSQNQVLTLKDRNGIDHRLSPDVLKALATKDPAASAELHTWLKHLEGFDVYFSAPLDLDMMMLSKFPGAYKETIPPGYGPRYPTSSLPEAQEAYLNSAAEAILTKDDPAFGVYARHIRGIMEWFPWYRYLFLSKGKPSTHLAALSIVPDDDLHMYAPPVIKRLLAHIQQRLENH